jgi:hypothetical protein
VLQPLPHPGIAVPVAAGGALYGGRLLLFATPLANLIGIYPETSPAGDAYATPADFFPVN